MLAAGLARADAGDTLNVTAGATLRHEDNLFRLPSNIDPQLVQLLIGQPTPSDDVRVAYFGIQLDKSYSQQTFHLEASAANYRYQKFGYLNYDAFDYAGSWKWHLTQRLSGTLSSDHKQTLASFADYRNYVGNNVITTENRRLDADWWLHGSWHVIGGVSEYRYRNTRINTVEDSLRQRSTEAGVRYVAKSGSSLTLLGRSARGDYPDRVLNAASLLDTGYRQNDAELRMSWLLSGKSALNGRLTHLQRRHENFAQRDFGGTAGKLDYVLTPTGKLQFTLSAARDIRNYQENVDSYYVNDSLAFVPVWQIGAKTSMRLNLERSRRDFLGGTAPGALPSGRRDQMQSAVLGFDWSPIRALTLSATLQHDSRSSNIAGFDYRANAAGVTAQVAF